jgi:hypothetical protein
MAYTEIDAADYSDFKNTIEDYSVSTEQTDSASGEQETEYMNAKASQQLGYYKSVPELKMAIDAKATWTIGKGINSEARDELTIMTLKGFGKDTFNSIIENLIREYHIYGDAYAEIIKDDKDQLINLKPLDPGTIKIIVDKKGIVKRYEQNGPSGKVTKFNPEKILHLCRNRIADEVHGNSIIESVEWIILARNEAMSDYKKLLHRNVYPVRIWNLDTDVPSKIEQFKAKVAASKGEGEDIFIPKGAVETELATVPNNSSLNPLPWIGLLNQYFFQAVGVPQIIIGGSQELTQTAAQIAYLAFEQTIEEEQLYIEEQVLSQLDFEINLEFPASLQKNLLDDGRKDGDQEQQLNKPSTLAPSFSTEGGI